MNKFLHCVAHFAICVWSGHLQLG